MCATYLYLLASMLTSIWFISSFLFSTPGEEVGIVVNVVYNVDK